MNENQHFEQPASCRTCEWTGTIGHLIASGRSPHLLCPQCDNPVNSQNADRLDDGAPPPCADLTVRELLEWLKMPQYTNGTLDNGHANHMTAAASLIEAGKRELAAAWEATFKLCNEHGFATGHGDTLADVIEEVSGQIQTKIKETL